ncbi:MAG TPA: mechanosensitive ion channel domain-containing protein [Rudaea sp.]
MRSTHFPAPRAWFALILSFFAFAAHAAETPAPSDPNLPPSHIATIDAALKTLGNRRDLDADARKQAEDLLRQAQDDEARADQLAQQRQALAQAGASADAAAQKLEETLATDPKAALAAWRAALPPHPTAEQLEALLARERDALTDARAAATSLQAELARQTSRPSQIGEELTDAHSSLDAAGTPPPKVSANALAEAQRLRSQAAQRLAMTQIAQLNVENSTYEPRMRLLSAQLRERQRAQSDFADHVAVLEGLMTERANSAIADLQARVARERSELGANSHLLAVAADANVALATKLGDAVRDLAQLRTNMQDWDKALRDLTQALKNTEERLRIGGTSEAVGLILLAEKSRLKPVQVLRRQLAELQESYARSRTTLIDLREHQDALANTDDETAAAAAQVPDLAPDRREKLLANLQQLLTERSEIVVQAIAQLTRLANAQRDAEAQLRSLLDTTEKLTAILEARLLWTPSHKPVGADWIAAFATSTGPFVAARWSRAFQAAGQSLLRAPLAGLLILALLALASALAWRAPARLEANAAPLRRIRTDAYRYTSAALTWTLLRAVPLPALLWAIGHFLQRTPSPGNGFADEIGIALSNLAAPAFVFAFLRALTMENGLAQYHFRWPRPRRRALHSAAPWLALLLLPIQFVVHFLLLRDSAASVDTFGRLLLIVGLLVAGGFAAWLLAPGRVWTVRDATLQEPLRLRQILRVLLVGGCAILIALVLRGYFVTALTLSARVFQTAAAVLGAAVLYGLAARWLVLGERRLALKRMEQRAASESESAEENKDGETLPDPEPEEITLASVSAQTRRLLRTVIVVGLAALLLWIWSDVAPALTLLGDAKVWQSSDLIDGKSVAVKVTLRDVLEALVAFALTWAAIRNLPGFLEIGLLRRFNVDAPTRYAITSVTRYLIVFVGVMLGMSLLGLHWSNLQWLAAGFSVGLGFGLQEIFANFISGLMVLFERPFRVGDIITIGTVEGTVKRIRTRATTIIDGDNREVIVPNKNFITDRLVNWTLSDSITRVLIKVGIAYRNDPQQAQKLMLDLARAHPLVLADPEPTCWMAAFGESTQDFELRVCVADVGQRNPVRTELQFQIAQAFKQNDIELAFPQMDLWFRNELTTQARREKRDQDAPSPDATSASKRA